MLGRVGSLQNAAYRGAADLQVAGDFGLAGAGLMQLPYVLGLESSGERSSQTLAVLPGMRQAGSNALAEDVALKLGKHR